ncbi:MAG: hypothetical protein GY765_39070, partial [bacterium]|nr:hypothetical protein [bacterium]
MRFLKSLIGGMYELVRTFTINLRYEVSRLPKKWNIITFLVFLFLYLLFVQLGVVQYNRGTAQIEEYKTKAATGAVILVQPSPMSVFFDGCGLYHPLRAKTAAKGKTEVYAPVDGAVPGMTLHFGALDAAGFLILCFSFLAVFYGRQGVKNRGCFRFISGFDFQGTMYFGIVMSRFIILSALSAVTLAAGALLVKLNGVLPETSWFGVLFFYWLIILAVCLYFLLLGTAVGAVGGVRTATALAVLWVFCWFLLPGMVYKYTALTNDAHTAAEVIDNAAWYPSAFYYSQCAELAGRGAADLKALETYAAQLEAKLPRETGKATTAAGVFRAGGNFGGPSFTSGLIITLLWVPLLFGLGFFVLYTMTLDVFGWVFGNRAGIRRESLDKMMKWRPGHSAYVNMDMNRVNWFYRSLAKSDRSRLTDADQHELFWQAESGEFSYCCPTGEIPPGIDVRNLVRLFAGVHKLPKEPVNALLELLEKQFTGKTFGQLTDVARCRLLVDLTAMKKSSVCFFHNIFNELTRLEDITAVRNMITRLKENGALVVMGDTVPGFISPMG